jgi:hypothetical protein
MEVTKPLDASETIFLNENKDGYILGINPADDSVYLLEMSFQDPYTQEESDKRETYEIMLDEIKIENNKDHIILR